MGKTAENIDYYLDPENDRDYLQDLVVNIKEAYLNQDNLTFKIVETKEKGFSVKVGGIFAFISFNHFAWSYPTIEFWKNASNSMVGSFFTGKIHKVSENPISIQIDAKDQLFDNPILEKNGTYRGVIVQKTKYGVFVDLGVHFNWKFGSLLGLIHKSMLKEKTDYHFWKTGNEITTLFYGFDGKGQLIIGDNLERGKWLSGELNDLIGTVQKTIVKINKNGQTEFYVLGEHKAKAPILEEFYPNFRTIAKKYIFNLKNGEIIDCEVVKINKRKDSFILKLLYESPTN